MQRGNIILPYSLHDMRISAMKAEGNTLTLLFENGFLKVGDPCEQVEGHLRFDFVDWDFSIVYLYDGFDEEGRFSGRQLMLLDFIDLFPNVQFEVVEEAYGYNSSKFTGFLSLGEDIRQLTLEIYHLGSMNYITDDEEE